MLLLRVATISLVVLVFGVVARTVGQLRQPGSVPAGPAGHVTVEVERDGQRAAEYSADIELARRVILPNASLPARDDAGSGVLALSPQATGDSPVVFVMVQSADDVRVEALPAPAVGTSASRNPVGGRWSPRSGAPCIAWQPFFIRGIGTRPEGPVAVHFWSGRNAGGSVWVDPGRHAIAPQPTVRFSSADLVPPGSPRAGSVALKVRATTGARPYLLLGVVRYTQDLYGTTVIIPGDAVHTWGSFPLSAGRELDFRFFALDDAPAWRSGCRGPHLAQAMGSTAGPFGAW